MTPPAEGPSAEHTAPHHPGETAPGATGLPAAATSIVQEVADRLTDPGRVARIAGAPDNVMHYPGAPQPVWDPLLLSDGHPGVGLLFAELAAADPGLRTPAHAHLSAGLASGIRLLPQSLFAGMVALAFTGQTAATAFGGYETMLAGLDRHITDHVRTRARAERERIRAGRPVGAWAGYDVLGGTAGIGRHLLARHASAAGRAEREAAGGALSDVLDTLVAAALADDITHNGRQRPVWWVTEGLEHGLEEHLNLGLAHGVCGPLALLSVAWSHGFRVAGQDEAVERLMALLSRWRRIDAHGLRWPHLLTADHLDSGEPPHRGRDSWCYGTVGAARAVQLAGLALDRADWRAEAQTALRGALAAAGDELTVDSALCHGWAGLLQVALRTAHDSGAPEDLAAADRLAARVIDGFDPESPFGFRYRHRSLARRDLDRPGFLEGAAGIALALHGYANGRPPATTWDAALLLA